MGHFLGGMVCEGIGWERAWKGCIWTWSLDPSGIQPWNCLEGPSNTYLSGVTSMTVPTSSLFSRSQPPAASPFSKEPRRTHPRRSPTNANPSAGHEAPVASKTYSTLSITISSHFSSPLNCIFHPTLLPSPSTHQRTPAPSHSNRHTNPPIPTHLFPTSSPPHPNHLVPNLPPPSPNRHTNPPHPNYLIPTPHSPIFTSHSPLFTPHSPLPTSHSPLSTSHSSLSNSFPLSNSLLANRTPNSSNYPSNNSIDEERAFLTFYVNP